MVTLKRPEEVEKMRASGRIVAEILERIRKQLEPGIRTQDIDAIAVEILKQHGATSPFLNKPHHHGGPSFPASTCVSVNEELVTVNTELQKKMEGLSRANNDMNNLLAGTGIGMLFVDHQLHIQRFTPATTQIINLIQTDIGRPVTASAARCGKSHRCPTSALPGGVRSCKTA